jgi:hypothetical protein
MFSGFLSRTQATTEFLWFQESDFSFTNLSELYNAALIIHEVVPLAIRTARLRIQLTNWNNNGLQASSTECFKTSGNVTWHEI